MCGVHGWLPYAFGVHGMCAWCVVCMAGVHLWAWGVCMVCGVHGWYAFDMRELKIKTVLIRSCFGSEAVGGCIPCTHHGVFGVRVP